MSLFEQAREISLKGKYVKKNFLSKKGEGARYWRYRMLRPLLKLYTHWGRSSYHPAPWLTPPAIEIFDTLLSRQMKGLEYGSGRSTLFFCRRLESLVSVEHNSEWFEKVKEMTAALNNVELKLIPPDHSMEDTRSFGLESFKPKAAYKTYYDFVLSFEDNSFDFILIDGRARVECALNSMSKLKSGGMLVLDNSERERYQPLFRILSDWKMVQTTNGLTNTTIWFKP